MKTLLLGLLLAASVGFNAWLLRGHQARRRLGADLTARISHLHADTEARRADTRRLVAATADNGLSVAERAELLRLRSEAGSAGPLREQRLALETQIARLRGVLAQPKAPAPPSLPVTASTSVDETLAETRNQLAASIEYDEALVAQFNQLPAGERAEWLASVQPSSGLSAVVAELQSTTDLQQQLAQLPGADPAEADRLNQLVASLHLQAEQEAVNVIAEVTSRLTSSRASLRQLESDATVTAENRP